MMYITRFHCGNLYEVSRFEDCFPVNSKITGIIWDNSLRKCGCVVKVMDAYLGNLVLFMLSSV